MNYNKLILSRLTPPAPFYKGAFGIYYLLNLEKAKPSLSYRLLESKPSLSKVILCQVSRPLDIFFYACQYPIPLTILIQKAATRFRIAAHCQLLFCC